MNRVIKVGILGATGAVGQRFISLLDSHPWFKIEALMASERSAGKPYSQAVTWRLPNASSKRILSLPVEPCHPRAGLDLVFSGLPAEQAIDTEPAFANSGIPVVSNTRSFRMDPDVPLIIPEVNPDHLSLINQQRQRFNGGFIVTNPNCSTIAMVMALAPLHKHFGISKVFVSTAQAVSGAGYPGLSVMSMLDNAIPYIGGEEPKLETEPCKLLGTYSDGVVVPAEMTISASCTRVAVTDGHLVNVSIKLVKPATSEQLIHCWNEFQAESDLRALPGSPEKSVVYLSEPDRPQPLLDRMRGKGMTASVGRLRQCPILDWKFTALGHNTIRGAAGGAILVAELLVKKGYL